MLPQHARCRETQANASWVKSIALILVPTTLRADFTNPHTHTYTSSPVSSQSKKFCDLHQSQRPTADLVWTFKLFKHELARVRTRWVLKDKSPSTSKYFPLASCLVHPCTMQFCHERVAERGWAADFVEYDRIPKFREPWQNWWKGPNCARLKWPT